MENDYLIIENEDISSLSTSNAQMLANNSNDIMLFTDTSTLDYCWSIKIFKVCVKSVSDEKVVLEIFLAGRKIATATLKADRPCIKIKESIGGDTARVDTKVCVDFPKKEIRAKGRVCAAFICVKFNQKILSW